MVCRNHPDEYLISSVSQRHQDPPSVRSNPTLLFQCRPFLGGYLEPRNGRWDYCSSFRLWLFFSEFWVSMLSCRKHANPDEFVSTTKRCYSDCYTGKWGISSPAGGGGMYFCACRTRRITKCSKSPACVALSGFLILRSQVRVFWARAPLTPPWNGGVVIYVDSYSGIS